MASGLGTTVASISFALEPACQRPTTTAKTTMRAAMMRRLCRARTVRREWTADNVAFTARPVTVRAAR